MLALGTVEQVPQEPQPNLRQKAVSHPSVLSFLPFVERRGYAAM